MDIHKFNATIPVEIGDIIKAEGYINQYEIIDIIFIYSTAKQEVKVYLSLNDIDHNYNLKFEYNDYKWKIITKNIDRNK